MAGVLSGVIKIPLTAVFLIAEITGGYALFVPLMIVSASSYFTSSYFENKSIYTKELEKRI
jgi:CIC family chloride channel protein